MQPQPQNCNNGSSPLSPDNHMQEDQHHHYPNQKSAIATTTAASAVAAASSASPMFPTSLHHHFHQMHQEGGFDHHAPPPHDDFLEQMLSSLNSASAWDLKAGGENDSASPEEESENGVSGGGFQFDESSTKLRAHQMLPMPFGEMEDVVHHRGSLIVGSSFDSFHPGVENQMAGLFNGSFVGSLLGSGQQMNHLPEHLQGSQGGPGFDQVPAAMNNNQAPMNGAAGAAAAQPKQRVRARRGQATDPHSIAERLRRERIAERMKGLQELVPNANKTDKASMLDEIIEYVKFLQLQVKVLSMSRLGGAGAVAPLVGDNMASEGGGDSLRARARAMMRRGASNGELTATSTEEATPNSNGNNTAVNENQVAKLMEEDMGSAMQYLQSKGLCLMPISLAAAISTAKNPLSSSSSTKRAGTNSSPLTTSNSNGPVSPKC